MKSLQSSNSKFQNSDKIQTPNPKVGVFDLEERTTKFGENVVSFCKKLEVDHVSRPLVNQLVRSATSIGANYAEANNASSRKNYRNKAHLAKKEVQETKHWLRMLTPCYPEDIEVINVFWQEAHELILILQSIINKINAKVAV